jgi:hypothetical protein
LFSTTRLNKILDSLNTRFLIIPWVKVPHLASHILGLTVRRIALEWQRKYGYPLYLLETFVEKERFKGACYKAANRPPPVPLSNPKVYA